MRVCVCTYTNACLCVRACKYIYTCYTHLVARVEQRVAAHGERDRTEGLLCAHEYGMHCKTPQLTVEVCCSVLQCVVM